MVKGVGLVARTRPQLVQHVNMPGYWHQQKISRQGVGETVLPLIALTLLVKHT